MKREDLTAISESRQTDHSRNKTKTKTAAEIIIISKLKSVCVKGLLTDGGGRASSVVVVVSTAATDTIFINNRKRK